MSKEINHWCVLCGKGYHACDTCKQTKSFTPWRVLTDSIEHFKIFTVLKDYNNKLISKNEAKEMLSNLDLSDKDSFKDGSKQLLKSILEETVDKKTTTKKSNYVKVKEVIDDKGEDLSTSTKEVEK